MFFMGTESHQTGITKGSLRASYFVLRAQG